MKHLVAMLFYNIVVGSTVMYHKDYSDHIKNKSIYMSSVQDRLLKERSFRVFGIYCMLFRKSAFKPHNLFRIGLVLENQSGTKDYCGINAVVPIDIL